MRTNSPGGQQCGSRLSLKPRLEAVSSIRKAWRTRMENPFFSPMASNKNQHFVPRCYLRPFSHDGRGNAINLFNIDRRRAIPNAPVKGQCSGDYFYGHDLRLEHALQAFEGEYAAIQARLAEPTYRLTDVDGASLRDFCCLQYLRTEAASRRAVEAMNAVEDGVGIDSKEFRLTIRDAVRTAMFIFLEARNVVSDLKVCLVRNQTRIPFITSDDPAVMTNRWHLQDHRVRGIAPGLQSAGILLLLPLSPNVFCVVYDGDVYSVANQGGWTTADREDDAAAFNQHQLLNAFANIYFGGWEQRQDVQDAFEWSALSRPAVRHQIHHAVFDRMENGAMVFVATDEAEARRHERAIVHQEAVLPIPHGWPRQIGWRNNGCAYTNGSAVGFIRQACIPGGPGDFVPEGENAGLSFAPTAPTCPSR
jgi:hypothetical protein